MSDPLLDLPRRLEAALDDDGRAWLADARASAAAATATRLPELLPQLPRRLGRATLGGGRQAQGGCIVDLDAWRLCDAGAYALLHRPDAPDSLETELFSHGDLEERTMVLRALSLLPVTDATIALLEEVQRTNTVLHVEAGACDSNLIQRATEHAAFGTDEFNRLVLKIAFLDLPATRMFGIEEHANPELSRMLQALATEREAAGRGVWVHTNALIARAPTAGTIARLIGHVEHGDDHHRLAAVEGLAQLNRSDLRPFLAERLDREPRPAIKAALQRALADD